MEKVDPEEWENINNRYKSFSEFVKGNYHQINITRIDIDKFVLKTYKIDEVDDKKDLNINIKEPLSNKITIVAEFLCWCVGILFSRWDIRFALDKSLAPKLPDPFDPLPVCPPGMLQGPDGLPACGHPLFLGPQRPCRGPAKPDRAVDRPAEAGAGRPGRADPQRAVQSQPPELVSRSAR